MPSRVATTRTPGANLMLPAFSGTAVYSAARSCRTAESTLPALDSTVRFFMNTGLQGAHGSHSQHFKR